MLSPLRFPQFARGSLRKENGLPQPSQLFWIGWRQSSLVVRLRVGWLEREQHDPCQARNETKKKTCRTLKALNSLIRGSRPFWPYKFLGITRGRCTWEMRSCKSSNRQENMARKANIGFWLLLVYVSLLSRFRTRSTTPRDRNLIPPHKRGISAMLARHHMKVRNMDAILTLRYYLHKVLRYMGASRIGLLSIHTPLQNYPVNTPKMPCFSPLFTPLTGRFPQKTFETLMLSGTQVG